MLISLITFALVSLSSPTIEPPPVLAQEIALPPLPPDTAVSTSDMAHLAAQVATELHPESTYPSRITIPAAGIDSPVIEVGVNAAGEMDVPDGSTNNVGWYKYGTVPGATGSAVMDAHVFAAFKRLKSAHVGDRVFVTDARGTVHEFEIISSKVYPVAQVPMETIFNDASGAYLNFITCEGRYNLSLGTYTHRRVVYAQLVS